MQRTSRAPAPTHVAVSSVRDRRGHQATETHNGVTYNKKLKHYNSDWDMSAQGRTADSHADRIIGSGNAGWQACRNRAYGAAYEDHVERALHRHPDFDQITSEVSLVPGRANGVARTAQELSALNGQAGTTTRADFLARENRSNYLNIECKSSGSANYTSNQTAMQGQLKSQGAEVVNGRGNYSRGSYLGSVDTVTVRPHNEDGFFAKPFLEPTAPRPQRPQRTEAEQEAHRQRRRDGWY